jgi:hypothetical protein
VSLERRVALGYAVSLERRVALGHAVSLERRLGHAVSLEREVSRYSRPDPIKIRHVLDKKSLTLDPTEEPLPAELRGRKFGELIYEINQHADEPLTREETLAIGNFIKAFGNPDDHTGGSGVDDIESKLPEEDKFADFHNKVELSIVLGHKRSYKQAMQLLKLRLIDPNAKEEKNPHANEPNGLSYAQHLVARMIDTKQNYKVLEGATELLTLPERLHALKEAGADLLAPCTDPNAPPAKTLLDQLDFFIRANHVEAIEVLQGLEHEFPPGAVTAALHRHDEHLKIPAAYATTKEMVDALVALGTDKHYLFLTRDKKWVLPPYLHSANEEVARAWMAHDVSTEGEVLLKTIRGDNMSDGERRFHQGKCGRYSVLELGWIKSPAIVNVLCCPDGPLDPRWLGSPTSQVTFGTVLHRLSDGALAQAFIDQIEKRDPSGAALNRIWEFYHATFNGHPLATAGSYAVVKVLLRAGAPVDQQVINDFRSNASADPDFDRYDDALQLLETNMAAQR